MDIGTCYICITLHYYDGSVSKVRRLHWNTLELHAFLIASLGNLAHYICTYNLLQDEGFNILLHTYYRTSYHYKVFALICVCVCKNECLSLFLHLLPLKIFSLDYSHEKTSSPISLQYFDPFVTYVP